MKYAKALIVAIALFLQGAGAAMAASYKVDVSAATPWVDTKIDMQPGEKVRITATGEASYADGRNFGPDGLPRSWRDLVSQYAVPDGGRGALVGRLGSGDASQAFLVGASKEYTAPVAGRLYLGLNQSSGDATAASGVMHVKIDVLESGQKAAAAPSTGSGTAAPLTAVTPAMLDQIPRRVNDLQGNPGDMVNAVIVGSQDQMVKAFTSAGWVQVDSSVQETVVSGLIASLAKKSYLTMPVSTLYLFERPQDYAFAHAEPVQVVMSRHHLRVWKSPLTVQGQPLWCVAATHDVGLERDQRNNGLTHKIDPAVDDERQYVGDTLYGTGLVSQRGYATPSQPLTEANTATGGSFHSDGRVLVLILKSASGQ